MATLLTLPVPLKHVKGLYVQVAIDVLRQFGLAGDVKEWRHNRTVPLMEPAGLGCYIQLQEEYNLPHLLFQYRVGLGVFTRTPVVMAQDMLDNLRGRGFHPVLVDYGQYRNSPIVYCDLFPLNYFEFTQVVKG